MLLQSMLNTVSSTAAGCHHARMASSRQQLICLVSSDLSDTASPDAGGVACSGPQCRVVAAQFGANHAFRRVPQVKLSASRLLAGQADELSPPQPRSCKGLQSCHQDCARAVCTGERCLHCLHAFAV